MKSDVSVITVCFNSVKSIEDTIKSVISQGSIVKEHLIIDGGSTDGTLEIVKKYLRKVEKLNLQSGPDKGIFDAINKGLAIAKGDWVALLHADDIYSDSTILEECVAKAGPDHNVIYGNLKIVRYGKVYRKWCPGELKQQSLNLGWMPPHPTVIIKNELIKKIGRYSIDYEISSDFEYCQRLFRNINCKPYYWDCYMINMSFGGISTKGLKAEYIKLKEDLKIMKMYQINPIFGVAHKKLGKLFQFISG